jgi:hypothetical protein
MPHDQEDQLQAHKPKIIPPPVGQDRPGRHQAADRTARVLQDICPGGTGFRHPQVTRYTEETRRNAQNPRRALQLLDLSPG